MGLRHVESAGLRFLPDESRRSRIERIQEDPFGWPDAGRKIDRLVGDDGATTCRPTGDHGVVAQHAAVVRTAAEFPQQLAVAQTERVQMSIITGHKRAILPDGRREADRALGEVLPAHRPCVAVQGRDTAVGGTAEQDSVAGRDRVHGPIERHARTAGPGRGRSRGRLMPPDQLQRHRQRLRRAGRPLCVATILWPVRLNRAGCDQGGYQGGYRGNH